jgi:hypothetical protein
MTRMRFVCIADFDESGNLVLGECESSWAVSPPESVASESMRKQFRKFITEDIFFEGVLGEDDGKTTGERLSDGSHKRV